ncbi:MAG: hypothetical protein P1U77_24015 [Rubripirellula sp.]|jgi:protein tyrosine phosphatase (PTP) superfamily phosphohydrolase (DUF442 family)|nr:hypothetical protein [Rubripirellula sp.]
MIRFSLLCCLLVLFAGNTASAEFRVVRLHHVPMLPNAFRIHPELFSGGTPNGDLGFAQLKRLGIKTIVSVDGATPDLDAARRQALRYVHLPHGYEGISETHAQRLAKAVLELPRPIYFHCHHGKHRSPAAAVVAGVGAGMIAPSVGVGFLQLAGTSEHYTGLYQAAAGAHKMDASLLRALPFEFAEAVEVAPMAKSMVEIEGAFSHLSQLRSSGWKVLAEDPDLDPAHEALILKEHFTELIRSSRDQRSTRFLALLEASRDSAAKLEAGLRRTPRSLAECRDALAAISSDCRQCHREYRDRPAK